MLPREYKGQDQLEHDLKKCVRIKKGKKFVQAKIGKILINKLGVAIRVHVSCLCHVDSWLFDYIGQP